MTGTVSLAASHTNGSVMRNDRMGHYCPQLDVELSYLPGQYTFVAGAALTIELRAPRSLHDVFGARCTQRVLTRRVRFLGP
jgi:hypothetical protein